MPQASTTSGTLSMKASATPDRQCVTPAPGTTLTTPIVSEERETPSAMNDAPCSSVTSTGSTADPSSASYSSMLCVPGMPNAKRAPASSSAATTISEPRSFMGDLGAAIPGAGPAAILPAGGCARSGRLQAALWSG